MDISHTPCEQTWEVSVRVATAFAHCLYKFAVLWTITSNIDIQGCNLNEKDKRAYHEGEICQCGWINSASSTRTHHEWNLRNDTAGKRIFLFNDDDFKLAGIQLKVYSSLVLKECTRASDIQSKESVPGKCRHSLPSSQLLLEFEHRPNRWGLWRVHQQQQPCP